MATRAIVSKLQTLLSGQPDRDILTWFLHYSIALLSVAIALGITLLLDPLLENTPAALFYVAVMVSSWFGGLGSGLLATLLSTFALNYFFLEPRYSLQIAGPGTLVQLGVFLMAAILISSLNAAQRSAKQRADANLRSWRKSEARFTHLAEANIIGIFQANLNGCITEANDAFLEMVGYTREDLLAGRVRWNEMTPPEYQQVSARSQQELRTVGVCTPFEKEYIRKDGSRVPILLGSVMQGEQSVIGFVLDRSEAKRNEAERQQAEAALRESEERLRLAMEGAQMGTWDVDLTTGKAIWSERHFTMLGYEPMPSGEASEALWYNRIYPEDRERVALEWQQSRQEHRLYRAEYRVIRADTQQIAWLAALGSFIYNQNGEAIRSIGVLFDITERRQDEEALREREQRLDLATSAANLGVFEWNIQTDTAVWENSRMYEIFGYVPEDGTLNKVQFLNQVIHPDDRADFELRLVEGMKSNQRFQGSCRIRRRNDAEWRWVEFSGQFELALDRTPLRLVGVLSDISDAKHREAERKQAEQDLRTAEERLRLALAAARMVVWDWNLQTNQVICSENSEDVWGIQIGTADDFIAVIHPADQSIVTQAGANAHQGEGIFKCEYRVFGPDGSVRWLHSRGRTHFKAQGQAERMIGVSLDVSDRVRIEAERDVLLRQEQAAREEAERANRIKDEFLAVLSHELRSPLNPILGWTKLLQSRKFDPDKTVQALATIERNAKLQAQLIEDLLDVSRIMQGKMALNVDSVNLATTIESAIETVRLAAEAKAIQIHTTLNADGSTVAGDAARLQQIVWNLLANAVKFTPQGGRVDVWLDCRDGFAQIQVRDTGKGISPEFLPYVFDYFRQEDGATTRRFGGLGLGLALVRHLTEQHGGTVAVESAGEGQGATFTVRLPLQPLRSKATQEPLPSTQSSDLNDLKILVIDDEADMRDLMQTTLEAQGAQVKVVSSAPEGLTLLEQWLPDLLISDIGMPEMDGYMLIRQVRSLSTERGGRIPAIALTAYAGEIDQQQAVNAGFQQHLAKPVEPDPLIQAIRKLLDRI